MAKVISLLSGKGGCGKTTIALGLSTILSSGGISTILIDCDMATNGATYFFESKMTNRKDIITLFDILRSELPNGDKFTRSMKPIRIADNFDFVPTNTFFPYDNNTHLFYNNLMDYIQFLELSYDAIILDCQAGFSELLVSIMQMTSTNLVILEPDAISSAAVRVLYAQLSSLIEKNKTYQVFSKITKEEYDIYNKVTAGTIFDNLPPLMFNWEVRKAFAFAQVPNIYTTNKEFGDNIFSIARVVFRDYEIQIIRSYLMQLRIQRENIITEIKVRRANMFRNAFKSKVSLEMFDFVNIFVYMVMSISFVFISTQQEYLVVFGKGAQIPLIAIGIIILVIPFFKIAQAKDKEAIDLYKELRSLNTQISLLEEEVAKQ